MLESCPPSFLEQDRFRATFAALGSTALLSGKNLGSPPRERPGQAEGGVAALPLPQSVSVVARNHGQGYSWSCSDGETRALSCIDGFRNAQVRCQIRTRDARIAGQISFPSTRAYRVPDQTVRSRAQFFAAS